MCRVCNPSYCRGKSTIVYVSVVFEQAYTTMGRRQWQPTPVLMPGKSLRRRSLVGCGPWGHEQSDTTEQLHFHLSLSCIGEGNGTPLQCSCLENPREEGIWWAAALGSHRVGHDWSDLATSAAAAPRWIQQIVC